ncbi:glutamine amidotransferase subunit pdxT [Hyaloscypha finlandica]|nr:glutamine amidotransferase subunit pdxT [Hyaloscypha finlandica]
MSEQPSSITYQLIGAHTRYSSWTARIETLLEYFSIPYTPTTLNVVVNKGAALPYSPSGLVPTLVVTTLPESPLTITDSLSIAEYLAGSHPNLPLWPKDAHLRALARSAVAEMHAGFTEMRNTYGCNFLGHYSGPIPINEKAKKEIERMLTLWSDARKFTVERLKKVEKEDEDEGFLFGKFGIADSFFWPVLWRFRTYNLPLGTATPEALAWMKTMWEDPRLKKLGESYWKQAEDPQSLVPVYENVFKDVPGVTYARVAKDWKFES